MATKSYTLDFDGYWREPAISSLPAKSGVYCVYSAIHNVAEKTVSLQKLLYIGEASDVQARIKGHEKWVSWKKKLANGEVVCISTALVGGENDRLRAEAAMIFKHKPPCNTEHVESFQFDQTAISTSGRNALLHGSFSVNCT